MAIKAGSGDGPGPARKPLSTWMADDYSAIVCPFCGVEKQSDDKLGRHFVHYHWREIEFATKRVRDMNARQRH